MKTIKYLLILFLTFTSFSCEDVVEIELESEKSRLVINAPLQWQKGTEGKYQFIELTSIADYYENTPTKVPDASVIVRDSSGNTYSFKEIDSPGRYECFDFEPQINETYELEVIHGQEIYVAYEELFPVVNLNHTEQIDFEGFEENMEIRAFFQDPGNEENHYLIEDKNNTLLAPGYTALSDELFNGNEYYAFHLGKYLEPGDVVSFKIFGVSPPHYNYLFKLTNSLMGGPFQTVPGLIRGNIENETNPDNYALGYFSLSQTDTITHVIE